MQEDLANFDSVYIHYELPWFTRLFLVYLLFVLCLLIIRAIYVARRIWSIQRGSTIAFCDLCESINAETLVSSALAKQLIVPQSITGNAGIHEAGSVFPILENSAHLFTYEWRMCIARVMSMKRMAILTVLCASTVFVAGTSEMLWRISQQRSVTLGPVCGAIGEILIPAGLGLLIAAICYAVAIYFEGALGKRRARWHWF